MTWTDIYSGNSYRINTAIDPADVEVVPVKTLRMVVDDWATNPEPKSLGPDGHPCGRATIGLLAKRPIRISGKLITYVGKESNRLDEGQAGLWTEVDDLRNRYINPEMDSWQVLVKPAIQLLGPAIVAQKAGLDRRTVERIIQGANPKPAARAQILAVLQAFVGEEVGGRGLRARDLAILLEMAIPRSCAKCGAPLKGRRLGTKYCDDRCRMGYRRAKRPNLGSKKSS